MISFILIGCGSKAALEIEEIEPEVITNEESSSMEISETNIVKETIAAEESTAEETVTDEAVDTLAVYWPEKGMDAKYHAVSTTERICYENYEINVFNVERLRSVSKRPARITVTGVAEDWVIEFTILVE